ncbi:MAG: hypothetical protein ACOC44_10175 [Promethearchaeia archaeon]
MSISTPPAILPTRNKGRRNITRRYVPCAVYRDRQSAILRGFVDHFLWTTQEKLVE